MAVRVIPAKSPNLDLSLERIIIMENRNTLGGILGSIAALIGIIGHIFDQKRLKAGLYRHPWDDIVYMVERAEAV